MSQLITEIEDKEFSPILTNNNPVLGQLYCLAEHSKILNKSIKGDILKAQIDQNANQRVVEYLSKDAETKHLITTSQAVDIIEGGVKSNALPEHVSVVVNSRIAVEENVNTVVSKLKADILTIADKFNLGLIIDNQEIIEPTEHGYFNYSLIESLEPAPLSYKWGKLEYIWWVIEILVRRFNFPRLK